MDGKMEKSNKNKFHFESIAYCFFSFPALEQNKLHDFHLISGSHIFFCAPKIWLLIKTTHNFDYIVSGKQYSVEVVCKQHGFNDVSDCAALVLLSGETEKNGNTKQQP